jgi:hypothetical protein
MTINIRDSTGAVAGKNAHTPGKSRACLLIGSGAGEPIRSYGRLPCKTMFRT